VVAIIAFFAVLTVGVVDARRPLDERVSKSFDRSISALEVAPVRVQPGGCTKERLYFYLCSALLHQRRLPSVDVRWRLFLRDDGCWRTIATVPLREGTVLGDAAVDAGEVRGCTG
jgi:hypothetical protein